MPAVSAEFAAETPLFRRLLGHLLAEFEELQAKHLAQVHLNVDLTADNQRLRAPASLDSLTIPATSEALTKKDVERALEPSVRVGAEVFNVGLPPSHLAPPRSSTLLEVPSSSQATAAESQSHSGSERHKSDDSSATGGAESGVHSWPTHTFESRQSDVSSRRNRGGAVGQFEEKLVVREIVVKDRSLKAIVSGVGFDVTFATLIMLNTLVMAAEAQYKGLGSGYLLGSDFPDYEGKALASRPANQIWPGADQLLVTLEMIFGIMFTLELFIKVVALKRSFIFSGGNWFDAMIVLIWILDVGLTAALPVNPMLLRLMRLLRLVRIARMVKTIQAFDSLQVLIGSITASMAVLFWSGVLLLVIQLMIALFFHSMLEDFIRDQTQVADQRLKVYLLFGTFTRAMATMFELTLGNWAPTSRTLVDYVSEWYGLFILLYKLAVGFAVVKVITGVFLHETFRVASTDDDLMVVQRQRDRARHVKKMTQLFHEADQDGDGVVSREEFQELLTKEKMNVWLAAMEIEPTMRLFDFMDDGNGELTPEELVEGMARLKGSARNIDVVAFKCDIFQEVDTVIDLLKDLTRSVENLQQQSQRDRHGSNSPTRVSTMSGASKVICGTCPAQIESFTAQIQPVRFDQQARPVEETKQAAANNSSAFKL